jgi:tetratricopeptide (TPR) repeat protein
VRKKDGQGVWQGDRKNVKDEGDFLRIRLNDEKQPDLLFAKADHTFVPDIQVNFGAPQKRQLKTRTNQLVGHYQKALSSYLMIQLWKYMPPLDPEEKRGLKPEDELRLLQLRKIPTHLLKMHHEAAVDALFWSGVCQFELGKYRSAIGSFQRYRQQNPDDSWEHASRYMQALAYAKSNQIDKAIAELSQSSRRAPQSAGYTILLRRWQKWKTTVDENRKDTP